MAGVDQQVAVLTMALAFQTLSLLCRNQNRCNWHQSSGFSCGCAVAEPQQPVHVSGSFKTGFPLYPTHDSSGLMQHFRACEGSSDGHSTASVGWREGCTLMPALALRVLFFLFGSTSAGCLPLFEFSDALRAKAERKQTDAVKQPADLWFLCPRKSACGTETSGAAGRADAHVAGFLRSAGCSWLGAAWGTIRVAGPRAGRVWSVWQTTS